MTSDEPPVSLRDAATRRLTMIEAINDALAIMLERDPGFIEIKARDTLDMCQPGEVVFRFDGDGGE